MKKQWWQAGVRFECQGSGRCCLSRGTHGYVYLTLEDRRRLAGHLGMRTHRFTREYCSKHDDLFYLKPLTDAAPERERACRFLEGKRCGVYEGRPAQCRSWPFWPENMGAKAWQREVASLCPGVGKGPLRSAEEIRKALTAG